MAELQKTSEANAEKTRKRMEAEISDLEKTVRKLEGDLTKVRETLPSRHTSSNILQANKDHVQDLQTAHNEYTANLTELAARLQRAEEKAKDAEARCGAAIERATKFEQSLAEKEKEMKSVQAEFDDLVLVFGDLEDKSEKYKTRLKELGENVSDGEDAEDVAEEDDDID